ncbi:MAG: DUF1704 domain-containing protein [bacterium]|nr:DUF1704 domain-containing protein [bacterium]
MSFLDQLTPLNLQEEKQEFFADHSYNPQFVYAEPVEQASLEEYPKPTPELTALAKQILAKETGRTKDVEKELGRLLSQAEVTQKAEAFLKMHGLENKIAIIWSASFVSRATITKDTLKFKTLSQFRELETAGMLFHEIGTHALRRVNYEQQPWYRKKKKYGFGSYLETEEGLATLHGLLPMENKSLYKSAIRYLAVHFAQTLSFAELWTYLTPLIPEEEERWMVTVRQKRGLTDTTQPGLFTKDTLYFSGAIKMAKWLETNNFDLTDLYLGKLAAEDATKAREMNQAFVPRLPSFFMANCKAYQTDIEEINLYNRL